MRGARWWAQTQFRSRTDLVGKRCPFQTFEIEWWIPLPPKRLCYLEVYLDPKQVLSLPGVFLLPPIFCLFCLGFLKRAKEVQNSTLWDVDVWSF